LGQPTQISAPFAASPTVLLKEAGQFNPPSGHSVAVLFRDLHYRLDEEGLTHATDWTVYRIVSMKDADDWNEVDAVWSSWRQKRPVIRARVITPDGVAHELDPKKIEETSNSSSDPNLFSSRKRLRAPLPAIVEGAVVETLVNVEDTEAFFGAGAVNHIYLIGSAPLQKLRVVIDAPQSAPVQYVLRLAAGVETRQSESAGRVRLEFETGPSEAAKLAPPDLPSNVPRWPSLTFAPKQSWSEAAQRFAKIVDAQISEDKVRPTLPPLPKDARREQIASILSAYLHDKVRYTGVEFGDAAWVPRKPSETFENGFGDCKDKAAALISMLRTAGVEARLALLQSGPGPDIEPEVPGLGMFDHAIVYVPGDPALWIDATEPLAIPGQLPITDQNRYALIVGGTSALQRTPGSGPADNRTLETREFFLPALGKARVVETSEASGAPDLEIRATYADADDDNLRKGFQEYGQSAYLAKKLSQFEHGKIKDLTQPFKIRAEFLEAGRGVVTNTEAVVAIPRDGLFMRLPRWLLHEPSKEAEPRTQDVELPEPFTVEWRYRLQAPAGFQPRELPPSETQKLGPATYSHSFQSEGGVVTGAIHFDTGAGRMTSKEAAAMRDGVVAIMKAQPLLIYFDQSGEKLLADGKIREALVEFHKLSAAEPKEAVHRTRIARALLEAGIGNRARQEARAALVQDAGSSLAHQTLGWILQHDLVGRRFEKGFDLAGAISSYRKAKELDPDSVEIRGDLAILLEHNSAGQRYGKGASLAEAIEEYRSVLKLPDSEQLLDNLLIVSLRAGRVDVLKEVLPANIPDDEARKPLHIAARAVVNGPAQAIQLANRSIPDSQKRMAALAQAAIVLTQSRLYSMVAEFYTAAARSAPNPAQLLANAQLFSKVKRWEGAVAAPDTPERAARDLMVQSMIASEPEKAIELLSHHHQKVKNQLDEVNELKRMRRQVQSQTAKTGMGIDVIVDVMLASWQAIVEGDARNGYRVKARMGNRNTTFVVVKEGEQYRVLDMVGSGNSAEFIGYEVLARVEQGRLLEARSLLDWVREEVSPTGGDDPLAGPLFPRFWQKGQPGNSSEIRQAGSALLAADKDTAPDSIPLLESNLKTAADDTERQRLTLALANAYQVTKRPDELLRAATALAVKYPGSDTAFTMIGSALMALGRWAELDAHTASRLKKEPPDPLAARLALDAAVKHVNLEAGRNAEQLLRRAGKLESGELNQLVWMALLAGKIDEQVLDTVQQGIMQSQANPSANLLHTAAAIFAEAGKSVEAREILLQSLDVRGLEEPDSDAWYVFGRISENYGEVEAAIGMYAKVTKPESQSDVPSSTFALAQRRLSVLNK
jgi:tetratricopeptide (TPR) repeat protein